MEIELNKVSEFQKTEEGIELTRENVSKLKIKFFDGLSKANIINPERPRDKNFYIKNILNPLIRKQEISDGSKGVFDDRKLRFDKARIKNGILEVHIGVTYFQEFKEDEKRDPKNTLSLHKKGLKIFKDKYAFFTRPLGVTVALQSKDNKIFIGKRLNKEDKDNYEFVSGFVDYKENINELDLIEDVFRETNEEFGIKKKDFLEIKFLGVVNNKLRGDVDFLYLGKTNKSSNYFLNGEWKKFAKDIEHKEILEIKDYKEIEELLETGKISGKENNIKDKRKKEKIKLRYAAIGILRSIKSEDMN